MGVNYTSIEGVKASLSSLKNFIQLLKDRRNARDHHELNVLVVKGKWYLDQFGQVGYLILQDQQYRQIPADAPIFAELGDVVTEETFRALGKKYQLNYQIVLGGRGALPTENIYCAHCGAHWHIDNLDDYCIQSETIPAAEFMGSVGYHVAEGLIKYLVKDVIEGRTDGDNKNELSEQFLAEQTGRRWTIHSDDGKVTYYTFTKYYHNKCHNEVIRQENASSFIPAIEKAGFKAHGWVRTRNEYGSKEYRGDWLMVDTQHGLLRVGWRKRVINIDYSGIDPYYLPVTEETFGPGYEHVSGYEELTKALATFRLYIESKKNFEVIIPHLIFGAQIE